MTRGRSRCQASAAITPVASTTSRTTVTRRTITGSGPLSAGAWTAGAPGRGSGRRRRLHAADGRAGLVVVDVLGEGLHVEVLGLPRLPRRSAEAARARSSPTFACAFWTSRWPSVAQSPSEARCASRYRESAAVRWCPSASAAACRQIGVGAPEQATRTGRTRTPSSVSAARRRPMSPPPVPRPSFWATTWPTTPADPPVGPGRDGGQAARAGRRRARTWVGPP